MRYTYIYNIYTIKEREGEGEGNMERERERERKVGQLLYAPFPSIFNWKFQGMGPFGGTFFSLMRELECETR